MRWLITLSLAAGLVGCAGGGTAVTGNRNVLTNEDIRAHEYGNVYDLIEAERPWWLRTRGAKSFTQETPIMVYMDGSQVGTVEELRIMSPFQYGEIRFYSSGQAQTRFGTGNASGAIELITQR